MTKKKEILKEIAEKLCDINIGDLTKTERNIAKILVRENIIREKCIGTVNEEIYVIRY